MTALQDSYALPLPAGTIPAQRSRENVEAKTCTASVIIVEYKSSMQVETFLQHMSSQDLSGLEYIIFRNSCAIDEPAIAVPASLKVKELRSARNLGFGAAFNLAANEVGTQVILSCNSDTAPCAGSIIDMIERAGTGTTLVAPILFNEHGEERGRPFYNPVTMIAARIPVTRSRAITGRADWVVGACFAISTSYFLALGGFHRAYKLYVEDVDLCWRVRSSGGDVQVLPNRKVFHAHGRASKKMLSKPFLYHLRGGLMFYVLHPRAIVGCGPRVSASRF